MTTVRSLEGPTMSLKHTRTQHLASLKLGRPLDTYVDEKRTMGWSWESIAEQLGYDTEGVVVVSRETLRGWYGAAA